MTLEHHPEASAERGDDLLGPSGLELTLPDFEGPLDLLLHLVRSHDMNILALPIVEVARQYNAYLDRMRELDLDVAGEYLVMAATLAHIKSRMMLPREAEEEDEEDPRAELSRQLLEYERFKKLAEELSALESGRDLVFARPGPPPEEFAGEFTLRADVGDLVRAFERVLERLEAGDRVEIIRRESVRVQDQMQVIVDALESERQVSFKALLGGCATRLQRVVLFLALLELIRLGVLSAWQAESRGDIALTSTMRDFSPQQWVDSELEDEPQPADEGTSASASDSEPDKVSEGDEA